MPLGPFRDSLFRDPATMNEAAEQKMHDKHKTNAGTPCCDFLFSSQNTERMIEYVYGILDPINRIKNKM